MPLRQTLVNLEPCDDGEPVAICAVRWVRTRYWRTGGHWALTVADCPFCHRAHYHGGGSNPRAFYLGWRVSDCRAIHHPTGGNYSLRLDPSSPILGPDVEAER